MKKILALLLTVSLLLGVTVLSVSAEEIPREDFEAAIIETAMAYYNKGLPIQYDSNSWTIQSKNDWGGATRLNSEDAPEEGCSDYTIYSVCSDWCYDVYYNAFGYKLMGAPRFCLTYNMLALPATDPLVVCKYRPLGDDPDAMTNIDEAIAFARDALEVGDVIIGRGSSDGVNYTGHTMLYIGDYKGDGKQYVIHCWGGKFNTETGVDKVETSLANANPEGGAIRIHKVTEVFSDPGTTSGVWNVRKDSAGKAGFIVLRPRATAEFQTCSLTPSARTRLAYRGLEVNKETGVSRYGSVLNGETLSLSVTVTNNGTAAYTGLTVTEPLPTGAVLKDAGGGTETDGALTWTVDVPAGGEVTLDYTVTVTEKRGGFVSFGRGTVGDLPTREAKIPVSGKKLTSGAISAASRLRNGRIDIVASDYVWESDPIETVNKLYSNIFGLTLDLPTGLNAYMEALCDQQTVGGVSETYGGWMWRPKETVEGDWQLIKNMIIPEHFVGRAVYLDDSPDAPRDNWHATNRVQEYKAASYEIGDIFLALDNPDVQTVTDPGNILAYVILGGGKVACADATKGIRVDTFDNTVACLYNKNIILGLRPTLAYDDFAAGIVRQIKPGDLNGDDAVDMRDLLYLRQGFAGGYDAAIDPETADLNRDGQINMRDLLTLRQYFAGGYGVVLE